jgi:GT2 family glycosyltransferase
VSDPAVGRPVPSLGVVILAYDGLTMALDLASRVSERGLGRDDVVVVHNPGPTDHGRSAGRPPSATVVLLSRNRGYAAAMNVGMRRIMERGADFVLLLTQDAQIDSHELTRLIDVAAANETYGIVGPIMKDDGSNAVFSAGGIITPKGDASHRVVTDAQTPIAACDWIDGSVMLLRREMVDAIGLIDERFFLYFEETDYSLRARRSGWRVGVVPGCTATQRVGARRRPGAYVYLMTRNGLEFRRRAAGWSAVGRMLCEISVQSLKEAVVLLFGRGTPERRADIRIELPARTVAVWHFARRRLGPPPRWLRGMGDVSV